MAVAVIFGLGFATLLTFHGNDTDNICHFNLTVINRILMEILTLKSINTRMKTEIGALPIVPSPQRKRV
jgi:hypothetical protein